MKKALSIFCFFIIAFVNIFAIDGNAYAFDGEYVDKFGKWYNKGTVIDIDCSFVQGQFHYIMDEKNGCAYFYFAYTDFLDEYSEDDIQLEFYVYNSINNYTFSVTNSGISDDSVLKNLDIYINFSNINADSHNGRLLVGFELKNKNDKKLTNFISCTFKVSSTKSCNLVDECKLDMYVKPVTTAKKVKKSENNRNNKNNKSKSSTVTTSSTDAYAAATTATHLHADKPTAKITSTSSSKKTCTITIECKSILDNMDDLKLGHEAYVPKNGIILSEYEATFNGKATVYDLLKKACDDNKIPYNAKTTIYSVYISGINNLDI